MTGMPIRLVACRALSVFVALVTCHVNGYLCSCGPRFVRLDSVAAERKPPEKKFSSLFAAASGEEEWGDGPDVTGEDDTWPGPEKSGMNDFISDFLRKGNSGQREQPVDGHNASQQQQRPLPSPSENPTHLIAIPVDACHELMIELESVQRAILYHCPILVHACITAAVTRLPLLYVDAGPGGRTAVATSQLHDIVRSVVKRHIFVPAENHLSSTEVRKEDGSLDISGSNADGIEPLLVPFKSLEIDGPGNDVLYTVANEDNEGSKKLVRLAEDLRDIIHKETGWRTSFPLDPHTSSVENFRPRIPFMRLPSNWEEFLEGDPRNPDDFLTSDQGGNGISPVFWAQWMDDNFGEAARMREVAVYTRRKGVSGPDEKAFYLPSNSIQLPKGNVALSKLEAEFEKYQDERMAGAKALGERESAGISEDDVLFAKTQARLGALYNNDYAELEIVPEPSVSARVDDIPGTVEKEWGRSERPKDSSALDDWMRERIQRTAEIRKTKPPIEDNPIFAKYKEGTLVPDKEKPPPPKELPPFPSREHCIGFWRVVRSPTGFAVEEGDSTRSDNLVLRVDGTTAGGPILDQETRQKASAGTWRISGDTTDTAALRIRLIIPPKKDRIIVMKGKLQFVSMSSDLPMTTGTFGIPKLEALAEKAKDFEDLLFCSGDVCIENADGSNRECIGKFSIMKLKTPTDPSQFTITIPRPVRSQD